MQLFKERKPGFLPVFFLFPLFAFLFINSSYALTSGKAVQACSISIDAPKVYFNNTITSITITDVVVFLKKRIPFFIGLAQQS